MDNKITLPMFFDCEFTGLHRNSTLVSLGVVSTTGSTFYAEFSDYELSQVTDWIEDNVISNLIYPYGTDASFSFDKVVHPIHNNLYSKKVFGDKAYIVKHLNDWMINELRFMDGCDKIRMVSDCYAYDWMLFVDLLSSDGTALMMPEYVDYIPLDISTLFYAHKIDPDINRESFLHDWITEVDMCKHNSLWDAKVIRWCYNKLMSM